MRNFERKLAPINFEDGQVKTLEIPRNYALRALNFMLDAQITISGTPTGEAAYDSCPAQLINRIEVVRDGSETLKSIDFETLHRHNQIMSGVRPHLSNGSFDPNTAGDYTMQMAAQLAFAMPRSFRPIDTLLATYEASTLNLIVTFGSADDISDNAISDIAIKSGTTPQLKIATDEMQGVPADFNFSDYKQHLLQKQVSAATSDFQIDLPLGNIYRGLLIKAESDEFVSNAIINNITIKSGTRVFKAVNATQLQHANKQHYGIETWPTGYYYLEFAKDGRLTEGLNSNELSSLELVLNVDNPGTTDVIKVYPDEVVAAPKRTAK